MNKFYSIIEECKHLASIELYKLEESLKDNNLEDALKHKYKHEAYEYVYKKLDILINEPTIDFFDESLEEDLIFEGLEEITEDELLKLNFLRLTSKEEVFNSYREELEEKYNG